VVATCVPRGKPLWSREARIGDYGGALDKEDSRTEGSSSYAWGVYRELRAMRGSAYSQTRTSLVHVENLAIARFFCGILRAAERLKCNALPGRASDSLDDWATVLAIPKLGGEEDWELRTRCAARYKIIGTPTRAAVETAVRELLGSAFSSIVYTEGTLLSAPPDMTYWPAGEAGPAEYDLGGGTWMSRRAHVLVYVERDNSLTTDAFDYLVQFQLMDLLRVILPAHATYDWALEGTGFYLDVSRLDYDAL